MFRSRTFVGLPMAAGFLSGLLQQTAKATLIWTGSPSQGTSVFKVLNLEDANKDSEPNPSPNGSSIATSTDLLYGPDWQFYKAAPDLRAEAHGAAGFDPASGNTYYLGWVFKVNSTVSDNAVFQWKAYGGTLEQNYPLVLSFSDGSNNNPNVGTLQFAYYAPPDVVSHVLWTQSVLADQWNSVVLAFTVSQPDTTSGPGAGAVSFWFDGTEENLGGEGTSYVGSTFDGTSVDPKWGIYGAVGTQVTNDVADLKIGTAYSDVAPTLISAPNLTWNNTGASSPDNGQTWDSTNNNWNNGTGETTYADGATLTFNDTNNGHYAVTLNTTVTPGSVTFSNSAGNYIISGNGSIAGAGYLAKTGTSMLTIDTANTYTGGTWIDSGTVVANSSGALGSAAGVLALGTAVPEVGGTTTPTGTLTMNASITVGSFSSTTDNTHSQPAHDQFRLHAH
jgi:autotransporter-associated beta strand protein